jgi:hypothetical protein
MAINSTNSTNHTVYQLKGITAFSNEPAVNTRSVDSGHLIIDASASANMLTIEGVTYAYNKQSVNNVLDTQFNYFKFPVQVVYSPIDIDVDITIPEQPIAEPEELEKPDPIFARYKPNESINLPTENWAPIELSDIEDGNAQKKPNKYYINKAIKDENKPLRFRFNWNITVEGITGNDTVMAQITMLHESPNRPIRDGGWNPGWTTGYEWPNLPPDTVDNIKNGGNSIEATLTPGLNTGMFDITVPWWDYDQGDKFSVVIIYYKEQWDTKWHWFGQNGGAWKKYWDESWNDWYRKVKNGRYVTKDVSDQPDRSTYIRDMKTLVDPDWWEEVLNTYVEPTKRGLVQQMRTGKSNSQGSISNSNSKNWNYGGNFNIYNGWIRDGFSYKGGTTAAASAIFGIPIYGDIVQAVANAAGIDTAVEGLEEGHIGTTKGKQEFNNAKAAFDARDPKIIINADKTWLSVTNAEKQVDVWNRKLTSPAPVSQRNKPAKPAAPLVSAKPAAPLAPVAPVKPAAPIAPIASVKPAAVNTSRN